MSRSLPNIPLTRPVLGEAECAAAAEVLLSGWVTQGPMVERFEQSVADYVGANHAVAVANGTAALHLALLAAGIEAGDEVIVPSLTFIATANAIRHCGAKPVFADIDPDTYNLDPVSVGQRISPKTKVIMAVHQFGRPANLAAPEAISARHGCTLIEDAACALGSSYREQKIGAHSALVCFSFHPRKVITTGEGGMITTNDGRLADKLRRLRHHGMNLTDWQRHTLTSPVRESFDDVGFNFRLSDLAAAVGVKQMERLEGLVMTRRRLAAAYDEAFEGHAALELPRTLPGSEWNGQTYALCLTDDARIDRECLLTRLRRDGIGAKHGLACIHQEPCYAGDRHDPLPKSEQVSDRMFLLPLFPEMTPSEHRRVIESVLAAVDEGSAKVAGGSLVEAGGRSRAAHLADLPRLQRGGQPPQPRQRRVQETLAELPQYEFELIFVDDHSTDRTRAVALQWARDDQRVRYVRLSRNFGSHAALGAGLEHSTGHCAVLLASDLQDPPELIPQLLAQWEDGSRVVWATRTNTLGVRWTTRLTSRVFWWLMRRGAPDATPVAPADFVLIDRAVIDAYGRTTTRNESLLATICWLGFQQSCVPYDKAARRQGRSGWTLAKRWKLCVDSIVGFSYWPIRVMSGLGFAVALCGFTFLAYVIWHRLSGRTSVPGWAATMAVMLAGMGLLMAMIGVLGEYLWRVLDEIRGRPKYVIEEMYGSSQERSRAEVLTHASRPTAESLTQAKPVPVPSMTADDTTWSKSGVP